ncbi:cytochrome c3 family protein [Geobacter sp. FeAm09]|uniref:cytochrome c3 family protein n=1 Tax=Geobacter sp. FeAm09 TaxID=2597769 RepID=UPI00143DBD7A
MKSLGKACILILVYALFYGASQVCAESNKPFTADRHKTYGVTCKDCHGDQDKKNFNYKQCLACHDSYQKVAERTKKREFNPHKSHYDDVECNACHHGHKVDENFCATCHSQH